MFVIPYFVADPIFLGETIQHELKCATIGFMFITIIRHIKSLQKKQMHHTSTEWVL